MRHAEVFHRRGAPIDLPGADNERRYEKRRRSAVLIDGAISRATAGGISTDVKTAGKSHHSPIVANAISGLEFDATAPHADDAARFLLSLSPLRHFAEEAIVHLISNKYTRDARPATSSTCAVPWAIHVARGLGVSMATTTV